MKVLHTSDWHLGRSLYGKKRYSEFSAFLDWLAETIVKEEIDLLLVAGDIFDTNTPSNRAQQLYYRFLCRVAASACRHVVVIAGNHDSPSFLEAPKALLHALNVYVVGAISETVKDEVLVLRSGDTPEAIICAVPYLRDKDIRWMEAGESIDDKNAKLAAGIKHHYAEVCKHAEKLRSQWQNKATQHLPLIGMGHLFTSGGLTVEGDGVRELYVGSLSHVDADIFPRCLDYVALGHLHVPQRVGDNEHIRYCGSPLPMGFGEATQQKLVLVVEFSSTGAQVKNINIPCFQSLQRISGNLEQIQQQIDELKLQQSAAWLEIEYTGQELVADLRLSLDDSIKDTDMEIRRIKNQRIMANLIQRTKEQQSLDELSIDDVFLRCLQANNISEEQSHDLQTTYKEIIRYIHEQDVNAE